MNNSTALRVVVEGQTDAVILRSLLGEESKGRVRFYTAVGRVSTVTVGRNLLVLEGGPILVVMDSDTLNPKQAKEEQALASYALTSVAPGEHGRVFMFSPEIEVVFFEAPQALERLLGRPVSPEEKREGLLTPKETLSRLLKEGVPMKPYPLFLESIDPQSAADLATGNQARALKETVSTFLIPAAEAV